MATKKKTKAKSGARKVRRVKGPKYLSRLDPLLVLVAKHAERETKRALKASLRTLKTTPETALSGVGVKPPSITDLPVGMQSLAAQISPTAVRNLVNRDLVTVLVDSSKIQDVEKHVKSWKGKTKMITQSTMLVYTPRSRLRDLASLSSVNYVEASTRLEPHCDLAHVSTGLVRAGNRAVSQLGNGVLVGIVDTGIDASHLAFKTGNKTRIVNYLDQVGDKQYDEAQINVGHAAESPDEIGHGTHVAGIAVGNGRGSPNNRFEGVAPEADIAIVKTTFDSADITAGVAHIFNIADQRDQPCVVNLSLGGHFGGHDGSSITERTIDQLSDSGRIVVVSAGNEGGSQMHASTVMLKDEPSPARWVADFELNSRMVQGSMVGLLFVQVWHQKEDDINIRLRSPNGELFEPPQDGEMEIDRGVFLVQSSHQRAIYSGDNTTTFLIISVPEIQWLTGWSVIAEEDRTEGKNGVEVGSVHAWIVQRAMGRFTNAHTRSHLVGMPGTAFSAITVASYATRNSWDSHDDDLPASLDAINLEDISYFSSPGPTRDSHNKPDVAAPGQWLVSALSDDASLEEMPSWLRLKNMEYAALQGTSMSAPYTTGVLALLLEKDPSIDWAEAKRRLIKSTRQDGFTTPCWNPRWGYGKLNVERLLTIEP